MPHKKEQEDEKEKTSNALHDMRNFYLIALHFRYSFVL